MEQATSVSFGLDDFEVVRVARVQDRTVRVVIQTRDVAAGCPGCGVVSFRVKERPLCRVKDLDASGQQVQLWWRK